MMYKQQLAAAIKVNGKVLREFNKDTVYIPYGSEYSILVKNLNSVRVIADIFVDGENAVPGGLVISPNQEVDLERWIKNGNMSEGNRFKFIERTAGIEKHRGAKLEDGLVRIEYRFEMPYLINTGLYFPPGVRSPVWGGGNVYGSDTNTYTDLRNMDRSVSAALNAVQCSAAPATNSVMRGMSASASSASYTAPASEVGITVPGSKSDQKFQTVASFTTEPTAHSMVFHLLGETEENRAVREPVTVKAKPRCQTCGKQNKANAKFCSECGTALEIYA